MDNYEEAKRWLDDATDHLERVERNATSKDYPSVVHYAQLCIETSAKAIIAYFSEPKWSHDPGTQLNAILDINREWIEKAFCVAMIERIEGLCKDVTHAAPWHGRSIYGEKREDGKWYRAAEICTEEIATNMIEPARNSHKTASDFLSSLLHTES